MFRVCTPIIRSIRCWVAAYGFLHRPHHTHDPRSGSQDHHPSTNSVQKTICCNSTSNAPDEGCMRPKTCRAKNTSIKLPSCIKLAFHFISRGRCTVKQPSVSLDALITCVLRETPSVPLNAQIFCMSTETLPVPLEPCWYGATKKTPALSFKSLNHLHTHRNTLCTTQCLVHLCALCIIYRNGIWSRYGDEQKNCGDSAGQRRIRFFRDVTQRMPTSHSDNALLIFWQWSHNEK